MLKKKIGEAPLLSGEVFDHSAKGYAFEPSSDHKLTNCSLSSEWVPFMVKVKGSKRRRLDPIFHMLFPKTQLVLTPLGGREGNKKSCHQPIPLFSQILSFTVTNLLSVESNEEQKKFINMQADLDFFCSLCFEHLLTLVLLNPDIPCLYKQYPD